MHTNTHPAIAAAESIAAQPEFATLSGASRLFGVSRSSLYNLEREGAIRFARVRRRGHVLGRVLVDLESVRSYLRKCTGEVAK